MRVTMLLAATSAATLLVLIALLPSPRLVHAGGGTTWTGEGDNTTWTNPCNWYPKDECGDKYPGQDPRDTATLGGRSARVVVGEDLVISTLNLSKGITLTGKKLTVLGAFNWSGGTIANTIDVPAGLINISGKDDKGLVGPAPAGGVINSGGRATWIDESTMKFAINGEFNNQGTFDIRGRATFYSDCCATRSIFHNDGTLNVSFPLPPVFAGQALFQGVGLVSGARSRIDVDRGQVLDLDFGHHAFLGGTSITGKGRTRLTGWNLALAGTTHLGRESTFELSSGDTAAGGVLAGDGGFDGPGTFEWSGGVIRATLSIAGDTTFLITREDDKHLDASYRRSPQGTEGGGGGTITNHGTARWTGDAILVLSVDALIKNDGTFEFRGDPVLMGDCCASDNSFRNTGTLLRSTSKGPVTFSGVGLVNQGTLEVRTGSVELQAGRHLFDDGSKLAGDGRVRVTDWSLTLKGRVELAKDTVLELASGRLSAGGVLLGDGLLAGEGTLDWTGGTARAAVQIGPDAHLDVSGDDHRVLDSSFGGGWIKNAGHATWAGNGTIDFVVNGQIENAGDWVASGGGTIGGSGTFTNRGTFSRTGAADTTTFDRVTFENTGQVTLKKGVLELTGGAEYRQWAGSTELAGGRLSGGKVALLGGELSGAGTATANVENDGATIRPDRRIRIEGSYEQTAAGLLDVTLAGGAPGANGRLEVSGEALLAGPLHITLAGGFVPRPAQVFQVVSYGERSGAFDRIDGVSVRGPEAVDYRASALRLALGPAPRIEVVPGERRLAPTILARAGFNRLVRSVSETRVVVTVTDAAGNPRPDYSLQVAVQPVDFSGGHAHADVNVRPHGWARPGPSTNAFPPDNAKSGSTDAVEIKEIKTDAAGRATFYYIAPEFGGVEVVGVSSVADPHVAATATEVVRVTATDGPLRALTAGPDIQLVGQTARHPDNHYGTATMLQAIAALARNFREQFRRPLGVNDISLVYGGLFDIGGTFGPSWTVPHRFHRVGESVDLAITTADPIAKRFRALLDEQGWWDVIPEGTHFHLELAGTGKVSFEAGVVDVRWLDTKARLLRVGVRLVNRGGLDASAVFAESARATAGVKSISLFPTTDTNGIAIRKQGFAAVDVAVPAGVRTFKLTLKGVAYSHGVAFAFELKDLEVKVPN